MTSTVSQANLKGKPEENSTTQFFLPSDEFFVLTSTVSQAESDSSSGKYLLSKVSVRISGLANLMPTLLGFGERQVLSLEICSGSDWENLTAVVGKTCRPSCWAFVKDRCLALKFTVAGLPKPLSFCEKRLLCLEFHSCSGWKSLTAVVERTVCPKFLRVAGALSWSP